MTVVVGSNPEETNLNKKESLENIEENSKNINSVNEDSQQCEVLDVGLDTFFSCDKCEYESETKQDLKLHTDENIHDIWSRNKSFESKTNHENASIKKL